MKKDKRILNGDIRANRVQLITDDGDNLWEMSLKEAKTIAYEKSLDLMLMWKVMRTLIMHQKKKREVSQLIPLMLNMKQKAGIMHMLTVQDMLIM